MIDLQGRNLNSEEDVSIYLHCENTFLSISLGFYLKGHLSIADESDFIITDIDDLVTEYDKPICLIGKDLYVPCSVHEMFTQLHDFYNQVNAKQASIFHKRLQHINQNENKMITRQNNIKQSLSYEKKESQNDLIESIKNEKMRELLKNTSPELSEQIEILFNELSRKIYDTLNAQK